jgi:acyl-CoA thioesterase I
MNRTASLTRIALLACSLAVTLVACGSGDATTADEPPSLFDAPSAGTTAPGAAPEIPANAPTVVFLGDSIGAGLHLAEHQAFPALLQARLAADGLPFELVNASESGRTSSGGVTALDWVMRTKPELVVIELGGNDGLRGIELATVEQNLRRMVEIARDGGADVLLLGVRLPPNYGEYGADFDAIYPRLAAELELHFEPSFMRDVGGVPSMNLADGLHPTAAGHERLADNVLGTLRDALQAAVAD